MHDCGGTALFKALVIGFSVGFMLAYAMFEVARVRQNRLTRKLREEPPHA